MKCQLLNKEFNVEEYLNQRADITLKLNGIRRNASGSAARVDFVMKFKQGISVSWIACQIHVTDIRRGSIIVQFVIDPVPIGE